MGEAGKNKDEQIAARPHPITNWFAALGALIAFVSAMTAAFNGWITYHKKPDNNSETVKQRSEPPVDKGTAVLSKVNVQPRTQKPTELNQPPVESLKTGLGGSSSERVLELNFQIRAAEETRLRTCWDATAANYPRGVSLDPDLLDNLNAMHLAVERGQAALEKRDFVLLKAALEQLENARRKLPKGQC